MFDWEILSTRGRRDDTDVKAGDEDEAGQAVRMPPGGTLAATGQGEMEGDEGEMEPYDEDQDEKFPGGAHTSADEHQTRPSASAGPAGRW